MKTCCVTAFALIPAVAICAAASIASAGDSQTASGDNIARLTPGEQGYFFVGGQYVESGGKRLMAGQMYVEYLTPQNVTRPIQSS
jgi:hypothetical protein